MLQITAYGRLASSVTIQSSNDLSYTNFLLATHETKDKTTFIRCVAFGSLATLMSEHCAKGDRVLITGDLIPDKYKKIDTFKIKVNSFEFVETLNESMKNRIKNT